MAVVFISPKQRQKMFFLGITVALLLFVSFFSVVVFFMPEKNADMALVFNKPKVTINMSVFDSQEFKDLKPFAQLEFQYSYIGFTKQNQPVQGFISAASIGDAQNILTGMDYTITTLQEVQTGRDNPFTPYYDTAPATQ